MGLFEVYRGLAAGFGNGANPGVALNTMAHQVVMSWYQAQILDGNGYQIRAGTITTPLVGPTDIADTESDMAVDAALGTTIIPVFQNISVRLATGTLFEFATKSVATVSSSGTAFVPLPLKSDGGGSVTTARVQAVGAVTVTAETTTTTLRHWSYSGPLAAVANGGNTVNPVDWEPAVTGSPVLVGPRSLYVQIAAAGTGPSYYANLDYIELATLMVNPS